MNQEQRQIEVPSFTPEQVQALINYANEKLPTMYGNQILAFVEKVALDNEKAKTEEVKTEASN